MSKLQEMRKKASLSQLEFAKLVGINVGTLRHYEQHSKKFDHARIDTILKSCIVLNCRLEDLIEKEEFLDLIKQYEKKREE